MRAITVLLVFLLSTLFFWTVSNRFLFPSRAAASPVRVFFEKETIQASSLDEIPVNVFLLAGTTQKISAAQIAIKYPTDLLEFVKKNDSFVDETCKNNSAKLTTQARVVNDSKTGVVTVSRLSTGASATLPSGLFCFGTVVFRPRTATFPGNQAVISLINDASRYEIVGPGDTYVPQFDQGTAVTIKTVGLIPTPSSTIPPAISSMPPIQISVTPSQSCFLKSSGDANCDGVINFVDFELWRREYLAETPPAVRVADFNSDQKSDLIDFSIWRKSVFDVNKRMPPISGSPRKGQITPIVDLKGTVSTSSPDSLVLNTGQEDKIAKCGFDITKNILLVPASRVKETDRGKNVSIDGWCTTNYTNDMQQAVIIKSLKPI